MYFKGEGVPQNNEQAVHWYRLAAEQGQAAAQQALGYMYSNGEGVPEDDTRAVQWFRLAAEQGRAGAQNNLGLMHVNGEGVEQGYAKAMRWFRRAAEQGHAEAQANLGTMYDRGHGVSEDDEQAVHWYKLAAGQGLARAQYKLGMMYEFGEGVPEDDEQAVHWYKLAAEQGLAWAQVDLGHMYRGGKGVPQDDGLAVQWYRRAAERGHARAQSWVGYMYRDGRGVPQDAERAVEWFRRAAEQGEDYAQWALGYMYGSGEGVPQDFVAAHKWCNLAAAQGSEVARECRQVAVDLMSRQQIAEAQRLAREWSPKLEDQGERGPERSPRGGRNSQKPSGTGSGFYVSAEGHILSNAHVISSCRRIRIPSSSPVEIVARDEATDLALLQHTPVRRRQVAKFRSGRGIRSGESVVVVGFPLRGIVASEANVTTGTVSALAGPEDDRRLFQITAPVQPGNSGGPILDGSGNVVGVVVAKLDALRTAFATGSFPENVNFGVSAGATRAFLDAHNIPYETAPSKIQMEPADISARGRGFTVPIECW